MTPSLSPARFLISVKQKEKEKKASDKVRRKARKSKTREEGIGNESENAAQSYVPVGTVHSESRFPVPQSPAWSLLLDSNGKYPEQTPSR